MKVLNSSYGEEGIEGIEWGEGGKRRSIEELEIFSYFNHDCIIFILYGTSHYITKDNKYK